MSLQYLIILALNVFLLELNQCCSEYKSPPNEFNFLLAIYILLDCDMVPGIWYNAFTYRQYNATYHTNTISDALILYTPSLFLYQREEFIQLDVSPQKLAAQRARKSRFTPKISYQVFEGKASAPAELA